jgi:ribosomal protein S12 methylthiotransferase accessory factor
MDGLSMITMTPPARVPWLDHRDRAAEATIAAASPAIDPHTGIISHIHDLMIEPDDPRLFHASVTRPDYRRLYGNVVHGETGGTGLTPAMAMASAIGETFERMSVAIYDPESLVCASYTSLRRDRLPVVAPDRFTLYADWQYAQPGFIYERLTRETDLNWTWGYSLTAKQEVLVPASLVFMPFKWSVTGDFIADTVTTGLSCGRSPVDATLSGLCEVIERDAIMAMWLAQTSSPRLDMRSGTLIPGILAERFEPSGVEVCVNDISTELPVPIAFAMLVDERNDGLAVSVGAAANLEPEAAVLKALLEAAQGRLWLKSLRWKGVPHFRNDYSDIATFEDHVRLFSQTSSLPEVAFLRHAAEGRSMQDMTTLGSTTVDDDLARMVGMFADRDLEVITVDVTQPDIAALGFHVIKVLVPGLADLNAHHAYPFLGRSWQRPAWTPGEGGSTFNPFPHPFP